MRRPSVEEIGPIFALKVLLIFFGLGAGREGNATEALHVGYDLILAKEPFKGGIVGSYLLIPYKFSKQCL